MEARFEALERTVAQHDLRIGKLEQKQAATDATAKAMQQDIAEAKEAAKHAAAGVDSLKQWLLLTIAGFAGNLLYMVLRG